jgi:hypothetical protein
MLGKDVRAGYNGSYIPVDEWKAATGWEQQLQ